MTGPLFRNIGVKKRVKIIIVDGIHKVKPQTFKTFLQILASS